MRTRLAGILVSGAAAVVLAATVLSAGTSSAGADGSLGGKNLNAPIVGISVTPDNGGYWQVASDGGVFAFRDTKFLGSIGGNHLNALSWGWPRRPLATATG